MNRDLLPAQVTLQPNLRNARVQCAQALEGLSLVLGRTHIETLLARCRGDPVLALAAAARDVQARYPLGSDEEDEIKAAVRSKVAGCLRDHSELVSVRAVLLGKIYSALLREFGVDRAHQIPREAWERALRYVRTFPLPGPDTLPAFSWLLLRARARLGMTQQALAERLGVSRRAYAAWESGRRGLLPGQEEWLREELARLLASRAG